MHTIIYSTWIAVQILIGYNLVLPLLLYFLYILKSKKSTNDIASHNDADYAIIVTAYEQTHSLPAAVESLLKLSYTNYVIYIIADKCDITNLNFNNEKVVLLRPEEELRSNVKSHFYAIENFVRPHNLLTIIDSDNIVDSSYLDELNKWFSKGYKAVQGIRLAKNLDTTYSCLDAARDIYYHFYDGKVLFGLNSSATLAGSGMAFCTKLYKDCLEASNIQGAGFDKVLQYQIVYRDLQIAFAETAIVYDEKTSKPAQLVQQRSRWINTWFKYFKFGFHLMARGAKNISVNQLLFGLILLRPPLFIFLILSIVSISINVWYSTITVLVWAGAFILFVSSFILSLSHSKTDRKIYSSLYSIPKFMFFQVLSLMKIRKANSLSVATKHFHNESI